MDDDSDSEIIEESDVPFPKRKKNLDDSTVTGQVVEGSSVMVAPVSMDAWSIPMGLIPLYLVPKEYITAASFPSFPFSQNTSIPGSLKQSNLMPDVLQRRLETSNRFSLHQEPNEIQRKSYKNENRCLLPNPLVVCQKDRDSRRLPRIIEGNASVKLVSSEGTELPGNLDLQLQCNDGSLLTGRPLDEHFSSAFSLKLLCTSEGNHFRLLFTIQYTTEDHNKYEEKILSLPFIVYSNRKKAMSKENMPTVIDLKPQGGQASLDTEIWIKGKGFTEHVIVQVGDKQANVIEVYDNLIVCIVPARYDIVNDTSVTIVVSNKVGRELSSADTKLTYTYYIHPIVSHHQLHHHHHDSLSLHSSDLSTTT